MKKFSLAARLGAATFAFFAACAGAHPAIAQPAKTPAMREWMAHQVRALQNFRAALSPAQSKLPSNFLLGKPQAARMRAYLPYLRDVQSVSAPQSVLIYGEMTPRIKAAIEREGTLTGFFPQSGVASANLTVAAMEHIATATEVKSVVPNLGYITNRFNLGAGAFRPAPSGASPARATSAFTNAGTGAIVSEGDKAHQADQARATYKATGKGIKIGVISDSSEEFQRLKTTGELPADATILKGQEGTGESEGTAMMEIIHDLAPDAKLEFATAKPTANQMAKNILALQKDGCNIIVDDISFANETPYQEDVVSAAIRQVSALGVVYLTSIGNSGNFSNPNSPFYPFTQVWDGNFVDGGKDDTNSFIFNDFTSKGDITNPALAGSDSTLAVLYWADPAGKSGNDYNLIKYDKDGNLVGASVTKQNGNGQAIEFLVSAGSGDFFAVTRPVNSKRLPIRLALFGGTQTAYWQYSFGPTGFGHNVSEFALSVGASPANANAGGPFPGPFTKDSKLEYFSSTGPRTLFFTPDGAPQTRKILKPDIVAADGVRTATSNLFDPFYGTSAAAPHAAAIAALAWSAQPNATAAQIKARMIKGVIDIGKPGFEDDSGYGIVMAPLVLQYTDPTPTPTPVGPTPTPTGAPTPTPTTKPTPRPTSTPAPIPSGAIGFSEPTYKVGEGDGQATISVQRLVINGQGAKGAVSVKYQTAGGGTATPGADYTAVSGTLSWADGDATTKTFAVPIVDDTFREPDETILLRLYDISGKGTLSPTRNTATLTIIDNDKGGETIPPKVAILSPPDGARVSNVEIITGTASDTGGSGLYSVSLLVQRPSDGSYWNGTTWMKTQTYLPTTLSGGNWARTSGNPPRSALVDDFLRIHRRRP